MSPRLASRPAMIIAFVVLNALAAQSAIGQEGGGGIPLEQMIKAPTPNRVIQRDETGLAEIPIVLTDEYKDARLEKLNLTGPGILRFSNGTFRGIPAGGPYTIGGTLTHKGVTQEFQIKDVFVGDLWVLAGQSNMQGVGDLVGEPVYNQLVRTLNMAGHWTAAFDPLHELESSPDPVHSGDPSTRQARLDKERKTRTKGAGLGVPFGAAVVEATGVPVGLVACAHGGTSMAQWNPAKKGEEGKSLYGSMLRQVKLAGGKVKGVLWYQGESDAMSPGAPEAFPKVFADFIKAVRDDFGQPDLPFYYVQIGRFVREGDGKEWNTVQDAQRRLVETVPKTAVVATIDLELDDAIHIGTSGLKRLGERLAKVALRDQYGLPGASTPTFDRVTKGPDNTLIVKFTGVNRKPIPTPDPLEFPRYRRPGSEEEARPAPTGGLYPTRHIAGFSIQAAGKDLPLIFDARVGATGDTVILKFTSAPPPGAMLWYGRGLDPNCNLIDSLDMAVPVFGPIALDGIK